MTTNKLPHTFFDPSLTPHNAREKGYKYIDDVIYDFISPSDEIKDLLDVLHESHGKLGTPTNAELTSYYGLYMPRQDLS